MHKTWILITAAIIFFLVSIIMLQAKLIFFPEKLPKDYAFNLKDTEEEISLTTTDRKTISGVLSLANLPKPHTNASPAHETQGVVLYFHGNAGSLRTWKDVAPDFTRLGFDILIIDYRGFGKSNGTPTEKGLYEDAHTAWRFLIKRGYAPEDIILYGRSVGSGVASELAASVPQARALILESPFTSLIAVAKSIYPFLLPALTLRFRFENDKKLGRTNMPVLLIHGERDEIISADHSRTLHAALKDRSKLAIIDQASHNDLSAYPLYHQTLKNFLLP